MKRSRSCDIINRPIEIDSNFSKFKKDIIANLDMDKFIFQKHFKKINDKLNRYYPIIDNIYLLKKDIKQLRESQAENTVLFNKSIKILDEQIQNLILLMLIFILITLYFVICFFITPSK